MHRSWWQISQLLSWAFRLRSGKNGWMFRSNAANVVIHRAIWWSFCNVASFLEDRAHVRESEREGETRSDFQIFSPRGAVHEFNRPAINYWPWYITTWLLYWALHLQPSLIYVHIVPHAAACMYMYVCNMYARLMCTLMCDNINISKRLLFIRTPVKLSANVWNCRMLTFTMLHIMQDTLINDQAQRYLTHHNNFPY